MTLHDVTDALRARRNSVPTSRLQGGAGHGVGRDPCRDAGRGNPVHQYPSLVVIAPTAAYDRFARSRSDQAARVICRAITERPRRMSAPFGHPGVCPNSISPLLMDAVRPDHPRGQAFTEATRGVYWWDGCSATPWSHAARAAAAALDPPPRRIGGGAARLAELGLRTRLIVDASAGADVVLRTGLASVPSGAMLPWT